MDHLQKILDDLLAEKQKQMLEAVGAKKKAFRERSTNDVLDGDEEGNRIGDMQVIQTPRRGTRRKATNK